MYARQVSALQTVASTEGDCDLQGENNRVKDCNTSCGQHACDVVVEMTLGHEVTHKSHQRGRYQVHCVDVASIGDGRRLPLCHVPERRPLSLAFQSVFFNKGPRQGATIFGVDTSKRRHS